MLSFVNTLYWNARTKYIFECSPFSDDEEKVELITIPNASLGVVDGEVNILLVLVDQVVKTNGRITFDVKDQKIPAVGSSHQGIAFPACTIRNVVNAVFGANGVTGDSPIGQADVYASMKELVGVISTSDCYEVGLVLASEISRSFHVDPLAKVGKRGD